MTDGLENNVECITLHIDSNFFQHKGDHYIISCHKDELEEAQFRIWSFKSYPQSDQFTTTSSPTSGILKSSQTITFRDIWPIKSLNQVQATSATLANEKFVYFGFSLYPKSPLCPFLSFPFFFSFFLFDFLFLTFSLRLLMNQSFLSLADGSIQEIPLAEVLLRGPVCFTHTEHRRFVGHRGKVTCLLLMDLDNSREKDSLISGGEDCAIKIWNIRYLKKILRSSAELNLSKKDQKKKNKKENNSNLLYA